MNQGSVGGLSQDKISVPIQYILNFEWQSKFPHPSSLIAQLQDLPIVFIVEHA